MLHTINLEVVAVKNCGDIAPNWDLKILGEFLFGGEATSRAYVV